MGIIAGIAVPVTIAVINRQKKNAAVKSMESLVSTCKNLILEAEYFHIDYIPLYHHQDRDVYNTVCPICGFKDFIATYQARSISDAKVPKEVQDISYLAVQKSKNKYDFVAMDNLTKEQILISPNVKMGDIKSSVRFRGGKAKEIIKVV